MAQEEIIFRLKVDAGDSASKVNDVDKEFDSLRQSIKDTEKEVEKLSKQFGDNSKEADAARKNLAKLNLAYEDLSRAATDVNAKFEEVYGELQPLTTRLGEAEDRLYELALAGKQNTKEYQDLLETVARYRQTQIETDRVVDNAAQTFSQKLGSAIQGAAAGFQLVQGASALFGEESEELEKTLLKVQAAMALADGIEGIRTALPMFKNFANTIKTTVVGAFSSLKGAIASTGIGALVIIITSIIANWNEFSSAITKSFPALAKIGAYFNNIKQIASGVIDGLIAGFKSVGKIMLDLLTGDVSSAWNEAKNFGSNVSKAYNQGYAEKDKELKTKHYIESTKQQLDLMEAQGKDVSKKRLELLKKELTLLKKGSEDYNAKLVEIETLRTSIKQKQADKQKEINAKSKENEEKNEAERLAKLKERQELQNKINALTIANINDVNLREISALKEKHRIELQELKEQYGKKKEFAEMEKKLKSIQGKELADLNEQQKNTQKDKDKAEQEKENRNKRAQLEVDIINAENDFNEKQKKRIELETLDYNQKKANTELTNGEQLLLKAQHEKNLNDIAQESKDRQIMLDEELANSKKNLQIELMNVFGAIAGLSEENSALQKAYALTQLSIDTAKSISSVIAGATAAAASTGPAAPFVLAGYIASGIATVSTALSTANKILNAPSPSVKAPQMNRPTDNTQNNATQGTQTNVQAQSTYKVVVVDSDITKMQDKTKKVNAISTI